MMDISDKEVPSLYLVLLRLSMLQREAVDRLMLREAVESSKEVSDPQKKLLAISKTLHTRPARWRSAPDQTDLPALIVTAEGGWGILRSRNAVGKWVGEWWSEQNNSWEEIEGDAWQGASYASVKLTPTYRASQSPVLHIVWKEFFAHKKALIEGACGGLMLVFLGILVSLFSMQVYDRVVPTGAYQTLLVLTLGVCVACVIEYVAKQLRSSLYDRLVDSVDRTLARLVFLRFLDIRLDQLPPSVGSLASQLRGYETVRGFLSSLAGQFLVDLPCALLFVAILFVIGGWLAAIPFAFLILSILMGLWQARKIRELKQLSTDAANLKMGLLVENVEAAEIIKSGQGGWRMLGKWLSVTDSARDVDYQLRHLNETAQYRAASMQQFSYVLLVAAGAWMASHGTLTIGALVACSILSGRVLGPVAQFGLQITNWEGVRSALQSLDALWKLEGDHAGCEEPVFLEKIHGGYRLEEVLMTAQDRLLLSVPSLTIRPGEKIAVLGQIGAGKTSLLRLLSGMYKPQGGRIWMDDVDIAHLSKPLLAENMGYLPQDGRLVTGTLRENLTLGLMDPGDDVLLAAAKQTGLYESVIANHPLGLQRTIHEGGTGLSGGQRQLVNLTRAFLRRPKIWLLDEPTASLDGQTEKKVINALAAQFRPEDTVVLVTHKAEMLALVDRLIVLVGQEIHLDGPRDEVIAALQGRMTEKKPNREGE